MQYSMMQLRCSPLLLEMWHVNHMFSLTGQIGWEISTRKNRFISSQLSLGNNQRERTLFVATNIDHTYISFFKINIVQKANLILKFFTRCPSKWKMIVLKRYSHRSTPIIEGISVGGGIGVGCGSKFNSRITRVEDSIESLEPSLPIDEIESRSRLVPG